MPKTRDGDALTFSAEGLPPGLSVSETTGLISGTIESAAGSPFSVTVVAHDPAHGSTSRTFTWTVEANGTHVLSGVVTGSGGAPVTGAFVYVFDAVSGSYMGAASMGPDGGYTMVLVPGSYKAYVQTNSPAYPDQWVGGSSLADATVIALNADTVQNLAVARPLTHVLSGVVSGSGGVPVTGAFVYVFDAVSGSYMGAATMGPDGGYTMVLAPGSYKAYVQTNTPAYPDQWVGGSSLADATVIALNADTVQNLAVARPLTHVLSGVVTGSGGAPVTGAFVYVFEAGSGRIWGRRRWVLMGATRWCLCRVRTRRMCRPTRRGIRISGWGVEPGGRDGVDAHADTVQNLAVARPLTHVLSGVVTGSGGVPVTGAFVYVFDAVSGSYMGAATMGPDGGYTMVLVPGSYKAYVQTNSPAYPDQWVGGSSLADATGDRAERGHHPEPGGRPPVDPRVVGCGDGFGWGAGDGGVCVRVRRGVGVVYGGGDDGS